MDAVEIGVTAVWTCAPAALAAEEQGAAGCPFWRVKMNRLTAILGLVILCVLASACAGTIRAIEGDYASDAPTVESIRPLAGVSGEEVQFEATLCLPSGTALGIDEATGLASYSGLYIWDFGTGAEPNISHDASPVVTLRDGQRGPYDCSLTLKGSCHGDEENQIATYSFTLTVAPLTAVAVAPLHGQGGGRATFTAVIGSGNVTEYAWDFGGACSPSGSNDSHPSVTFNDNASGFYTCRVIVSNAYELYEFPFVLEVTPKPVTE